MKRSRFQVIQVSLLAMLLAGCTGAPSPTQPETAAAVNVPTVAPAAPSTAPALSPAAPVTPSSAPATPSTPAASPTTSTGRRSDLPACGQPVKPGVPGIWLDVSGVEPGQLATRLFPAWTVPVQAIPYGMSLHIPAQVDVAGLQVSVASESWQIREHSAFLQTLPSGSRYAFAVEPTEKAAPSTIFVNVEGLKWSDGSEVPVGPFTLQVYGPDETVPPCDLIAPVVAQAPVTTYTTPEALLQAAFFHTYGGSDEVEAMVVTSDVPVALRSWLQGVQGRRGKPVVIDDWKVSVGRLLDWKAPQCGPTIEPEAYKAGEPIGFVVQYPSLHGCGAVWGTATFEQGADGGLRLAALSPLTRYEAKPEK